MYRNLILASAALALASPAAAQQDSAAATITYDEAIDLALSQSATLQRARNDVELARLGVSGARTSFLPDVRLSVSGDQSYGRRFSTEQGAFLSETNESLSGRVS